MAGSIANVMLTQNDEVDSLSDLTQICLEIKSQVSAINRFHMSQEAKLLKNSKSHSRCLFVALCEEDFKFFHAILCNIPYKNIFC